jgi:hypothetical protein
MEYWVSEAASFRHRATHTPAGLLLTRLRFFV